MYYLTELKAIDPQDGNLKIWSGPRVWGDTPKEAQEYLQANGLSFCIVTEECHEEIELSEETIWLN